jgi:polyhydroxyalkanoate synthesis regulator protein
MEKITRYKNGTMYSSENKVFVTYEGILHRAPGTFYVIESKTKKDVTKEVVFLAEVEDVKKNKSFDRAIILLKQDRSDLDEST